MKKITDSARNGEYIIVSKPWLRNMILKETNVFLLVVDAVVSVEK